MYRNELINEWRPSNEMNSDSMSNSFSFFMFHVYLVQLGVEDAVGDELSLLADVLVHF
jgi:hypothetical protein